MNSRSLFGGGLREAGGGCGDSAAEHKTKGMFEIHLGPAGEVVIAGRLDATQCDAALQFLNSLPEPRVIDLGRLEYIASAGLRVLLLTQKRVRGSGAGLKLINVRPQIHDIFRYAGFDRIIEMTRAVG
jgi:anti-anti-sigma factor